MLGPEHRNHELPPLPLRIWPCLRIAAIGIAGLTLCIAAFAASPIQGGPLPSPLFPPDNWWYLDLSTAPVDPNSAAFISFINSGSVKRMHPDCGGDVSPGSAEIYGFPYIVVDGAPCLLDLTVSLTYGPQRMGMNERVTETIRASMEAHRRVYKLFVERTGLQIEAFDKLFGTEEWLV